MSTNRLSPLSGGLLEVPGNLSEVQSVRVTSKAIVALTRSGGVVAWGDAVSGAPDESSFQDHVVKNACASRASAIPTDLPQLRRQDLIASGSRKCCLQQQGMEAHVDRASNKEHHILLADFPSHR